MDFSSECRDPKRFRELLSAALALSFLLMSSIVAAAHAQNNGAPAAPMVLTVPTNYPTIQSAINAASAGDTVQVLAGNYTEQLFLNKSISLVGAGAASTVINAPKHIIPDSSGLLWGVHVFQDSSVNISGFTFGPTLAPAPQCTANNQATPCAMIGVEGGSSLNLSSSVIVYSYMTNGLLVGNFNPQSLAHAMVTNVEFQLPTSFVASPITFDGVYVTDGSIVISRSSIVVQPTLAGDSGGIFLDAGSTASISHNLIQGGVPIAAQYDDGVNLINASIFSNNLKPTGLSHFGSVPSAAQGAIVIEAGSEANITSNTITGGTDVLSGIEIGASNNPYILTVASIVNNTVSDILCTNLTDRPAGICGSNPFNQDQLPGVLVSPPSWIGESSTVHFPPGFASIGTHQDVHNTISISSNHISETDSGIMLAGVQSCCIVSNNVISNSTDYGIAAANGNFAFANNSISGGAYGATAIAGLANATVTLPGSEIQETTTAPLFPQSQSPYVAKIGLNETTLSSPTTTSTASTTITTTPLSTTTTTAASTTTESGPTTTTTSYTTSSSTTSSTTGGGIPEFPLQLFAAMAFVVLLAASYVAVRRRMRTRTLAL
ncbi:MAG TPA: right-handed parallel beta-helix repeat-containing protein [Nitrososphaerales archaeon]|nr:right-handed parallel beta-helix repeat-containing protein [Nitrososphaerales archaeon]